MEETPKTNPNPNPHASRLPLLLSQHNHPHPVPHSPKKPKHHLSTPKNHLLQDGLRKWLMKKGKGYLIDFDRKQRKKLKEFFNGMDRKKEGYVGVDQMEEMVLGLGLADGVEDVKRLISHVDLGNQGRIQFEEFMEIIQDDSKQNEQIVNFFKQLILSQIQHESQTHPQKPTPLTKLNFTKTIPPSKSKKQIYQNKLPFQMIVNQITRNHILASMNIGRCRINQVEADGKGNGGGDKERDRDRDREGEERERAKRIKMEKGKEVVKAMHKMEERRVMRRLRESLGQGQGQGQAQGQVGDGSGNRVSLKDNKINPKN